MQVEQDRWLELCLIEVKRKFHIDLPVEHNFIWQNTYTLQETIIKVLGNECLGECWKTILNFVVIFLSLIFLWAFNEGISLAIIYIINHGTVYSGKIYNLVVQSISQTFDHSVQHCNESSALTMELVQFCTESLILQLVHIDILNVLPKQIWLCASCELITKYLKRVKIMSVEYENTNYLISKWNGQFQREINW